MFDVEGLSRGTGDEAGRAEEVGGDGMVGTSSEELEDVMVKFVDRLGRRIELGTVMILRVDSDVV